MKGGVRAQWQNKNYNELLCALRKVNRHLSPETLTQSWLDYFWKYKKLGSALSNLAKLDSFYNS